MEKQTSFKQISADGLIRETARGGWQALQSKDHEFFARDNGGFVQIQGILIRSDGIQFQTKGGDFIPAIGDVLSVWTYNDDDDTSTETSDSEVVVDPRR